MNTTTKYSETKITTLKAETNKRQKTVISSVTTVFGALVFIALLAGFAVAAFYKPVENAMLTASAAEIEEIRVFAEDGTTNIEFGDVEDVTLHIEKSNRGWKMEQLDSVLFINQKPMIGVCILDCPVENVRLILPQSLQGVDLDFTAYGGSATINGDFNNIEILAANADVILAGRANTASASLYSGSELDTDRLTVKDPAGIVTE